MDKNLVGIIPAAGKANRLGPIPCSKEILPIYTPDCCETGQWRPRVAGDYLLEKISQANVSRVYMILRDGKWDIPAYFGSGKMLNLNIAYLMMDLPYGVPFTIDQAYPFIQDAMVVFGFPDILFRPRDAFAQLLDRQVNTDADLVLGLFPAVETRKMDMVELDGNDRVCKIEIKPASTTLRYTWIIAVWTAGFSRFMHESVRDRQAKIKSTQSERDKQPEVFVGDIIQEAIAAGLRIDKVVFADGEYLDIGTPEDLARIPQFLQKRQAGQAGLVAASKPPELG